MKPGKTDEWYTPHEIFYALDLNFDLDPCGAQDNHHVPSNCVYTIDMNGLELEWFGRVWLNPPFGGRNGYFPWLDRFVEHGNGIGLMTALTSSEGFHKYIPRMDGIVFPKGKTRFIDKDGNRGGCPFNGIVLFAIGKDNALRLKNSGLGLYLEPPTPAESERRGGE
jgi:hypothetical protein